MVNALDQVDRDILGFTGAHVVSNRRVIAHLCGSEATADKRLRALVEAKLLQPIRGLPGNRSVYQLTRKATGVAGVSPARAKPLGSQSLLKHLGILLYCLDPAEPCHRVENEELGAELGCTVPEGAHCVARVQNRAVALNVYVPGLQTPALTVLRRVRRMLKAFRAVESLRPRIRDGRYGILLLTHSETRQKSLHRAVRQPEGDDRKPLASRIRLLVRCVPDLGPHLGMALPQTPKPKPKAPLAAAATPALWEEPPATARKPSTRKPLGDSP